MKVNLVKELEQKQNSEISMQKDALAETKLLLSGEHAKDMEILSALAPNSNNERNKVTLGKHIQLTELNVAHLGNVYTIGQIENLAMKYCLKFLGTEHYCGDLPLSVAQSIREYSKKVPGGADNSWDLKTKYFILAPAEQFNLKTWKDLDPLLFYQIDSDHYKLIHKWGNDLNILRLIKGWSRKNINNYVISLLAKYAITIGLLSLLFPHQITILILPIIFVLFLTTLFLVIPKDKKDFTKTNWRSIENNFMINWDEIDLKDYTALELIQLKRRAFFEKSSTVEGIVAMIATTPISVLCACMFFEIGITWASIFFILFAISCLVYVIRNWKLAGVKWNKMIPIIESINEELKTR